MDHLEIKASLSVSEAGEIIANAWPFAEPDSVGDIITKGAINVVPTDLPMLFQHNPADLVGTWNETKETDEGFILKGKLHLQESARARAVRGMIQGGLVSGISIGFRTKASTPRNPGRGRVITALDLVEASLVRNPSHPRARILSAKQYDAARAVADIIERFTAALAA
jgi:HK97 family phage prohead protease